MLNLGHHLQLFLLPGQVNCLKWVLRFLQMFCKVILLKPHIFTQKKKCWYQIAALPSIQPSDSFNHYLPVGPSFGYGYKLFRSSLYILKNVNIHYENRDYWIFLILTLFIRQAKLVYVFYSSVTLTDLLPITICWKFSRVFLNQLTGM